MNKRLVVEEIVKAATSYGEAIYRYHQSIENVHWQKSSLENLHRWAREPDSDGRRKRLKREISEMRERLTASTAYSRMLSRRMARLEHAIEIKTRKLVRE
jgi:hypothetical protein